MTLSGHYDGQYDHAGRRTGRGILKLDNGDVYDGDWVEGRKQGFGSYYYNNGDVYEGDWWSNLRHGRGAYRRSDGTTIEGIWGQNTLEQQEPIEPQSGERSLCLGLFDWFVRVQTQVGHRQRPQIRVMVPLRVAMVPLRVATNKAQ